MNLRNIITFLITFLFCSLFLPSAGRPQADRAHLDSLFRPLVAENSPGYAVGIIRNGRLDLARTYGLANLASRAHITTATDFRLASLTKQFTAAAIMLLVREGKLHYDDP